MPATSADMTKQVNQDQWLFRRDRLLCFGSLALHLAANAHGLLLLIKRDIGAGQNLAGRYVARELDVMRQADRQGAALQASRRRNEFCVNGIAAFAVERFASFERA